MERSKGVFAADVESEFGVARLIARGSRSAIEQRPVTLANDQWQEQAALWRGE